MSHPYATAVEPAEPSSQEPLSEHGDSPPPSVPASPPADQTSEAPRGDRDNYSGPISVEDSRNLPPESEEAEGNTDNNSFSKSDTVVSYTDDVSSSSSSAASSSAASSSLSTSDVSSRSQSHASASDSSGAPIDNVHECGCTISELAGWGQSHSEHNLLYGNSHRHHRLHYYHRHHHHGHHPHPHTTSGLHGKRKTREEFEGYLGSSETSGSNLAGRVQTSELTRFTRVLAAGGRGTEETSGPVHPDPESNSQQQQRWWGRSSDMIPAAAANLNFVNNLPASAISPPQHPYHSVSPTDASTAPLLFSPSPVRKPREDHEERNGNGDATPLSADVSPVTAATTTGTTESGAGFTTSLTTMLNPHTFRPHSNSVTATLPTTTTPLPPTHPPRSVSAQSRNSNSPAGHGSLNPNNSNLSSSNSGSCNGSAIRASQTLLARNSSGCSPLPLSGADVLQLPPTPHSSSSVASAPNYPAALRRSSSFTAGMLSQAKSWVAEGDGHPYLISAAARSSTVGMSNSETPQYPQQLTPRVPPLSEKLHERTSSVASSVYSASSSARPSVPLPPSHVGPASNLMAAVWVDLTNSQPGSRCATPINSNCEAQPPQRRRRTTPRRTSEPPSPATSTLAASMTSSQDGNGYALSSAMPAAAAVLASVRMHYVSVGTQTERVSAAAVDEPSTPEKQQELNDGRNTHTHSPAEWGEGHQTPVKTMLEEEAREREDVSVDVARVLSQQPAHATTTIVLPATTAPLSLTSTEVSPPSLGIISVGSVSDEVAGADTSSAGKLSVAVHSATSKNASALATTIITTNVNTCAADAGGTFQQAEATEAPATTAFSQTYRVDLPPSTRPVPDAHAVHCVSSASTTSIKSAAAPTAALAGDADVKGSVMDENVVSPAVVTVSPVTPVLSTIQRAPPPVLPPVSEQYVAGVFPKTFELESKRHETTDVRNNVSYVQGVSIISNSPELGIVPPLQTLPVDVSRTFLLHPTSKAEDATQLASQLTGCGDAPSGHNGVQEQYTADSAVAAASGLFLAQVGEMQQLRSELAQMRTQYAMVLAQLHRMQQQKDANLTSSASAAVVEPPTITTMHDTDSVSPVSRSPSFSSPASPLSSSLTDGQLDVTLLAPRPATTTLSSSDVDAAATLQHVREALERTRHRATR